MKLTGGKHSKLILLALLVAALLFAVYYYVVLPKKNEVTAKENSIATLNSQVITIQQQIKEQQDRLASGDTTNTFELRKKVPAHRVVDDLLRDIEEMEIVSRTRVQTISFNNYDTQVVTSNLQDPNNTSEQTETTTTITETEVTTTEQPLEEVLPVSTISRETLPQSLQLLSLSVSVEAPDFDRLLAFIKEIEQLERVVRIDSFSYSLPGEAAEYDENTSTIVASTILLTTFYYVGED